MAPQWHGDRCPPSAGNGPPYSSVADWSAARLRFLAGLPSSFYPGVDRTRRASGGHMLDVAVVGGSAAGLFAALLLAQAGHQVLVLERDSLQPAPDVESAA